MQTKVVELDLNDVLPNRFQPRIKFSEESIQALSDSIKEHGVIQPIVVRTIGDKYEIIAGERRYKASVLAGKKTIPAIITDLNEKDSAEVAIIENVQRKDLTPIEEAISYKKILDMGYLTQDSLALKLGKTQSTIANKLRLLNLDDDVQEALLNEKISERHARSLLKLNSHEKQRSLLQRIINERLTVRKTDEEIDKMMNNNDNIEVFNFGNPEPVQEINNSQGAILETFNTNVESLNIPTEPIVEDAIPELAPTMEPKPTTNFFNPMPEVINSTVPPVSLDMFKEPEEEKQENVMTSNVIQPVNNVNPLENIDNMTDIFTEKPLAPIDSLLQSNSSSSTINVFEQQINNETSDEEESNEDILVPGKFFNLMPEEDEKMEEVPTNDAFNFNFDISGLNNVENVNNLQATGNSFENLEETKQENVTPMPSFNESLFDFSTLETNEVNQNIDNNLNSVPNLEMPTFEPLTNFQPVQEINNVSNESLEINQNLEIPSFNFENNVEESIPELEPQNISISEPTENIENNDSKNINSAIDMIREFSDNLSKLGYVVDLDEFDFENMYQVVFKINK